MYAKIFAQIFDSSIADNYELRHFFMDLIVLADCNGVVDMTQNAIAARTRIPLDKVKSFLALLEAPDEQSRTADNEGRRIEKFDTHRNWGWVITNYAQFRALATDKDRREGIKQRVTRHREKSKQLLANQASNADSKAIESPYVYASDSDSASKGDARGKFEKPAFETVKLHGIKMGLPESECEKFFNYYESNGWKVGKNPMKLWTAAMANWKRNWIERGGKINGKPVSAPLHVFTGEEQLPPEWAHLAGESKRIAAEETALEEKAKLAKQTATELSFATV